MVLGKYNIEDVTKNFETMYGYGWISILPTINYRNKYWYLYEFELIFWKYTKRIQIIKLYDNSQNKTTVIDKLKTVFKKALKRFTA